MRVGIGVTTYNRPECLKECLEHIFKHTMSDIYLLTDYDKCVNSLTNQHDFDLGKNLEQIKIYVADDSNERKGVAFRKNECLRALKDCDYVFLFDDDVKIIKDNWIEFFVNSGEKHLLFMNNKLHNKWNLPNGNIFFYKDCGGAFMFFTKEVIEQHGYMDETFGMYGFEHAEYSSRILGGHGKYPMLNGTEKYIYSEDYSNPLHKSSINDKEKSEWIKKNWNKFLNFVNK
jgi:GT2 family glycosyltransferase